MGRSQETYPPHVIPVKKAVNPTIVISPSTADRRAVYLRNRGSSSSRILKCCLPCIFRNDMEEPSCNPRSVLFICLGNICRSPIAEAVFRQAAKERGVLDKWHIDSAATANYHVGEPPDNRAEACLKRHGISSGHIVRQIRPEDFQDFAFILGMDHENVKNVKRHVPKKSRCRVELLGQYDPESERSSLIIEDPYYGGESEFDIVYEQCLRSCRAFLDHVEKEMAAYLEKK